MARRDDRLERVQDLDDAPSAEWGWHTTFPRGIRIAALLTVVALVAMMWPRDQELGQTHLLWLGGIALVALLGVIRPPGRRRR
jgi:hypothetical protein